MRRHIEQVARRLLRDGVVDNEVDAQLAALRILAAASGLSGDEATAMDKDRDEDDAAARSRHSASPRPVAWPRRPVARRL